MSKLVTIDLGEGSLRSGCPFVIVQITGNQGLLGSFTGSLPANPELEQLYDDWQLLYREFYREQNRGIEIDSAGVTNFSEREFLSLGRELETRLNTWLNSSSFQALANNLYVMLARNEEIRLIIKTDNQQLRRLPWHLWNFLERYPQAEVALSTLEFRYIRPHSQTPRGEVRILAIFGNSDRLDISLDRQLLEALPNVTIHFLESPQFQELCDYLWHPDGWDILFFAGHSQTEGETGRIYINQTDVITLEQLRNTLNRAIARGLQLAIFNSCDGLGLAQSLADLHIPQVIVMRELVPDTIAIEFLRNFLTAFSGGQSLYSAVREAREQLERLEARYPYATWLPVICQNPTAITATWQDLTGLVQGNRQIDFQQGLITVLLSSVVVTVLIMGMRQLGIFQSWELQAFDHLMQLRPEEKQDERLLVVTITEEDFQLPEQRPGLGARSLPDLALARLLEKLAQFKPRAIGLDIYHPDSISPDYPNLATRFQNDENFFAICSVGEANQPNRSGIAPPSELPPERQGFSDIVIDPDGILRRHLVAMRSDFSTSCLSKYALSTQLAFHYLARESKDIKYTEKEQLQIGDIVFNRLPAPISNSGDLISKFWRSRRGGYLDRNIDAWGYQILLNYRSHQGSPLKITPTVTLTEVLKGEIDPELVKDRIVIIGVTASSSASDNFSTPYSSKENFHQQMPGVIALAQMTSQILSAVLDGRPLISVLPFWGEVLWVWNWSVVGCIPIWCIRGQLYLILGGITTLGVLYLSCWGLLIQGIWIPLVPTVLAFVFAGVSVVALSPLT